MKAARYHGAKDIRVEEIAEPQPGYGQIKLKIAWNGICGTDLHEYLVGPMACPKIPHPVTGEKIPITLGHEFSGTIVALGEGVDSNEFSIGRNAIVEPLLDCSRETCEACKGGMRNTCDRPTLIGLSGSGGGLAASIAVDTKYVHILPSNIPLDVGACLEPLAVAWYAIKRANFKPGDNCLIVGGGPIGLFVLKTLKSLGTGWVGISEPAKVRREMSVQVGADYAFDPLSVDVAKEVKKHTGGRGVDIAFECAGLEASLAVAISSTKRRGIIMNVAVWESPPTINMMDIFMGEKVLSSSCCYLDVHKEVIDAVSSGKISGIEDLITKRISIDDVVEHGFEALVHDKENQIKILVHP